MKTKNLIQMAAVLIAVIGLSTAGCKKDKTTKDDNTNTTSMQQLSKDEQMVESSSDDVLNDANSVLSGSGGKGIEGIPCNVTVDSSTVVGDTITYDITFNGLNCNGNRYRSGHAKVIKNVLGFDRTFVFSRIDHCRA